MLLTNGYEHYYHYFHFEIPDFKLTNRNEIGVKEDHSKYEIYFFRLRTITFDSSDSRNGKFLEP